MNALDFRIDTATTDDLPAIAAVYRSASLSNAGDREALLAHPDALSFDDIAIGERRVRVARLAGGGEVAGFATTLKSDSDHLELVDLFVDPAFMRQGIALDLVRDAQLIAARANCASLTVIANPHAAEFYAAAGFAGDETVETRFGPGTRLSIGAADVSA